GGTASHRPVILRFASATGDLSDVPSVENFVTWVEELSKRNIRVEVVNEWGNFQPDAEVQVVRAVASDKVDLGWAGSRVFDSIGLSGVGVLSAPMLVDSYPLEEAVLASPIGLRLLGSLHIVGVTGLANPPGAPHRPMRAHQAVPCPGRSPA